MKMLRRRIANVRVSNLRFAQSWCRILGNLAAQALPSVLCSGFRRPRILCRRAIWTCSASRCACRSGGTFPVRDHISTFPLPCPAAFPTPSRKARRPKRNKVNTVHRHTFRLPPTASYSRLPCRYGHTNNFGGIHFPQPTRGQRRMSGTLSFEAMLKAFWKA